MSAKDNFNETMFSMFGISRDGHKDDPLDLSSPIESAFVQPAEKKAPLSAPVYTPSKASVTYLAPGTVMEGTLSSDGDVEIAGEFRGNISSSGHVTLRTSMNGNITAAQVDILGCTLVGDVNCSGLVTVDRTSSVQGNLTSEDALCCGNVKGNINAKGNVTLQTGSIVEGDIVTGTIVVERGAYLCGALKMNGIRK